MSDALIKRIDAALSNSKTGLDPLPLDVEALLRDLKTEVERSEELAHALRFYAEPKRYDGSNQRVVGEPDAYQPKDCPYLWDVVRDGGGIARKAMTQYTLGRDAKTGRFSKPLCLRA